MRYELLQRKKSLRKVMGKNGGGRQVSGGSNKKS